MTNLHELYVNYALALSSRSC